MVPTHASVTDHPRGPVRTSGVTPATGSADDRLGPRHPGRAGTVPQGARSTVSVASAVTSTPPSPGRTPVSRRPKGSSTG